MTRTIPSESLRSNRLLLGVTFAALIAGFAAVNLVAVLQVCSAQSNTRLLVDNMLTSVDQVAHLARDVDQKRILIEAHIFEKNTQNMEHLERRMAAIDADFAATARAYEPLANMPGEHRTWEIFQAEVAALQPPVDSILALSRRNEDVQAKTALMRLSDQFDEINSTAVALIAINHREAERTVPQIEELQRRSLQLLGGMTLVAVAAALFLSRWTSRSVRQRDELVTRAALLLENQNRELDAFAGRVAHDLRGPLSTISMAAARLGERASQEESTVAILRRGVVHMETLIQDLLTLATVDAQRSAVVCDARTVTATVEEDLRPKVVGENGTLCIHVEPAEVRCSEGLLRQVLWNLAENSTKYRRQEARLELSIQGRVTGRWYEFRVSDNGSGMTSDEIRHAFEPFFRGERARATVGTGIGLAIVKRVLEACGGTASIHSALGQGTTFLIKLQLAEKG